VSRRAEQRIVHFVALAGVAADDDVAVEVASVLGAGESGRTPVGQRAMPTDQVGGIAAAVGPGPALLVLDNCEHVLRGAADLVGALVSSTRDLRVLTTSRAPLGLSSESVYPLPELSLPTAVELFTQRARAARPSVELPADLVEEVCRHLDGLPLAVELAAARVRTMSVAEIARRLEDRFGLLRGGPRDAPERHQTLHAVVDWSWNLLEAAGRAAMRALSVFPAGFTADAARRVLGERDASEVDRVLEHLVDQSLLQVTDTPAGLRFRMLETVREFSTAQREAAGETERAVGGFLAWARDFGVAHHDAAFGPDPFAPLGRIRAEQDNLTQALRYGLARGDGGTVAATTAVLTGLWIIDSNYQRLMTAASRRPPAPTGRRTTRRCRRTPAWGTRTCEPPPWPPWQRGSRADGGYRSGSRLYSFLDQR
jgi:predicted ATPase